MPPIVARGSGRDTTLYRAAAVGAGGACVLFALWKWVPAISVAACISGFVLLACLPVLLEVAERLAGSAGISATALIWVSGNAGGIIVALLVQAVVHHPFPAFVLMALVPLAVLVVVRTSPTQASGLSQPLSAATSPASE